MRTDLLELILTEPQVAAKVERCLADEASEGGFVVTLQKNGDILCGEAVRVHQKKRENLSKKSLSKSSSDFRSPGNREFYQCFNNEFQERVLRYSAAHGADSFPNARIILDSQWMLDPSGEETARALWSFGGKTDYKSGQAQVDSCLRLPHLVSLNELKRLFPHTETVSLRGDYFPARRKETTLHAAAQNIPAVSQEMVYMINMAELLVAFGKAASLKTPISLPEKVKGIYDPKKREAYFDPQN